MCSAQNKHWGSLYNQMCVCVYVKQRLQVSNLQLQSNVLLLFADEV